MEESLKKRYGHLHPLIFKRSLERANTDVELFDILESIPKERPIVWDENSRRWIFTEDILQSKSIQKEE